VRVFFRDVFDHATRIKEACDTMSEMLSAAMNVNLAMVSVGQNEVVKRLAGWAGIIAVPTLVASVYGMNFDFMPELHWVFGYPLALGAMFGLAGWLYSRLKKAGWV
jgi:magnesium transporter